VKYLEDGRRYIGDFVWPGDLLGMDDLDLHDFGAESVTNMTLRRYPRRMVEALAQSNAALALRLRTLAAVNLRHAYQQMTLLARTSATERIAAFILDMHRRSTATDRRILYVPMSRTDIADYLGLSIETVCRSLAKLRRDGIVEPSQSGFELRNRPAMLELVHDSQY
jgi:CRP/FNR family nitrogen fixation transcriptional regulator